MSDRPSPKGASGGRWPSPAVNPWRLLGIAVLAQFGVSVVDQGIPTLTGYLKADFGLSAAMAGLVVSSFSFGKIFGSYAAGVAADRLGERRVLIFGGIAAGLLVILASTAPLAVCCGLLVLAGAAGASATPAGGRLVLLSFPRNQHGLALGIRQAGVPIAGMVAAATLPWLAHFSSWRWSLGAAAAVTMAAVLPLTAARVGLRGDEPRGTGLDKKNVPKNRNVALLTVWGSLLVSGQYAILAFLALDVHDRTHATLAAASLLVIVANAGGFVGRIGWGAVSDHALGHGRKPLLMILTSVGVLGAVLLFAMPTSAPFEVRLLAAAVAGVALIGFQGIWLTMIAEAAGPERVGAATGFAVTFATISIFVSPPLYGLVADGTGSYRAVWAALAVVLVSAFLPAMLVQEHA